MASIRDLFSILPFMSLFFLLNDSIFFGYGVYPEEILITNYVLISFFPVAWLLAQKELNTGTADSSLTTILSLAAVSITLLSVGLFLLIFNLDGHSDERDWISFDGFRQSLPPIIIGLVVGWRGFKRKEVLIGSG